MEKINQYPDGYALLWMASYRSSPERGDMNGPNRKISGTLQEAAAEAQRHAEEHNLILQCLNRRY